jgi:hypothetical protein
MQSIVTGCVIQRVFHIQVANAVGTAFAVDVDGRQYLITAKHLASQIPYPGKIGIYHEGVWKHIDVSLTGHADGDDVSVLACNLRLAPDLPLRVTTKDMVYGQEVFFLGFPLGLISNVGPINRDFPLPIIKRATLASQIEINGKKVELLDGINNPGFSGGPVVCVPPGYALNDFQVIGVISGYQIQFEKTVLNGKETEILAPMNSGLIICTPIWTAVELIKRNSNGFPLRKP